MINLFNKTSVFILVIFVVIVLIGCSDDSEDCDQIEVPRGYEETYRYESGDYETIHYGKDYHNISWTTYDNGECWEKAESWW